jgi:hypothetical protein
MGRCTSITSGSIYTPPRYGTEVMKFRALVMMMGPLLLLLLLLLLHYPSAKLALINAKRLHALSFLPAYRHRACSK